MSTVPFGKYKGRPVEDMLADADYMGWLESQPWFRERFAHLSKRDSESLQRTPEHNRLQALFVDHNYCLAFSMVALPKVWEQVVNDFKAEQIELAVVCLERAAKCNERATEFDNWDSKRSQYMQADWGKLRAEEQRKLAAEYVAIPSLSPTAKISTAVRDLHFEVSNIDVKFWVSLEWRRLADAAPKMVLTRHSMDFSIEIKPVMADDYPVVLRQMLRNKSEYLFLGSYEGQGATYSQVLKMFAASGKRIVLKEMVDVEAARAPQ